MPLNLFHSSADESWASRKFLLVFVCRGRKGTERKGMRLARGLFTSPGGPRTRAGES